MSRELDLYRCYTNDIFIDKDRHHRNKRVLFQTFLFVRAKKDRRKIYYIPFPLSSYCDKFYVNWNGDTKN